MGPRGTIIKHIDVHLDVDRVKFFLIKNFPLTLYGEDGCLMSFLSRAGEDGCLISFLSRNRGNPETVLVQLILVCRTREPKDWTEVGKKYTGTP